jgi:hypothetical protein
MFHSLVVDDWLHDFNGWRAWADGLKYEDAINPSDGVRYPGIYRNVPTWGVRQRLSAFFGEVRINAIFLRLSPEGVPVPHQAHHDALVGRYSMMVYLNRPEHCRGGTSLLKPKEGMQWERDTNRPEMWDVVSLCEMQPNRAFIFRADLWHRAEPIGGFGKDARDGRLVMTAFFDA